MNSDEMLQAMEHVAVDWRGCREVYAHRCADGLIGEGGAVRVG
jgi:hypothetical protein